MKGYRLLGLALGSALVMAGPARAEGQRESLALKDLTVQTARGAEVGADGSLRLLRDTTRLRLLTDNLGMKGAYQVGASYRYLAADGEPFEPKGDPGMAKLVDGAIAEHAMFGVGGHAKFTIEIDLKAPYLLDVVRLFGFCRKSGLRMAGAAFSGSVDGKTWEKLGDFPKPHLPQAYEVFPLEVRKVAREIRFIHMAVEAWGKAPVGLGEVEVWGYPLYVSSGSIMFEPMEEAETAAVGALNWKGELAAPDVTGNPWSSLTPLAERTSRPLQMPRGLTAKGNKYHWTGNIPPNTTYHYRVSAVSPAGETAAAEAAAGTTGEKEGDLIFVTWHPVAGATAYRIYRGDRPGDETLLFTKQLAYAPFEDYWWTGYLDHGDRKPDGRTCPPSESKAVPLLPPGKVRAKGTKAEGHLPPGRYRYRVAAVDGTGESTASDALTCSLNGTGSIRLKWSHSVGATGYKVYRANPAGAFDGSLLASVGRVDQVVDDGTSMPGNSVTVWTRSGATPEACQAAEWARSPGSRTAIKRFLQYRLDLFSVGGLTTPKVSSIEVQEFPSDARARHLSNAEREQLGKTDRFPVMEAEDCKFTYFFKEDTTGCVNTVGKGTVTCTVAKAGTYRIGVVYKDDEDGLDEYTVSLNGEKVGRIIGDRMPWMWSEHDKDSNFFLWLTRKAHAVKVGDKLEVKVTGPTTLCYRVDKLLLVPLNAEPLQAKP